MPDHHKTSVSRDAPKSTVAWGGNVPFILRMPVRPKNPGPNVFRDRGERPLPTTPRGCLPAAKARVTQGGLMGHSVPTKPDGHRAGNDLVVTVVGQAFGSETC